MSSVHAQFATFYEKYPHLKRKIQFIWGTAECRKILSDTLLSDRSYRAGEVARRYSTENIVMVVDGAGWHRAQFDFPGNLRLHFLPPYSPELNPQEHIWDDLREKYFHNKVFDSLDALENQLVVGLNALENNQERVKSITGWEWIINAVSIDN